MSPLVPPNGDLQKALLSCFHLNKSAAEGHKMLCEANAEHTPLISTREFWHRWFKSGDFDTSDKE